ncbi:MAG: EI24 domain-containing protein [cyanobacterium endosymbiont of Rhopalodia musculus]|uniref:EI24 domain-containing protein n=1 Tax=cyanobacterium endosymbiont of Epithemia clementina EcSB TaxID=3034674 RepID=UPI0024810AE7|nr:EI24 domain-containing protein [cyanobacterium endosymbiont of Epithemia clementina EcSB]WGT67709.1 EI24 domain-containing protein [cyanobacterium endosymbiont of Epithemia clementina EcSB]
MKRIISRFGFFSGATYPFRLLEIFRTHPSLLSHIIIPILINLVLGIVLYLGLLYFGWQISQTVMVNLITYLDTVLTNLPSWLKTLDYFILGLIFLVRFLLGIILLILTGFILVQFGVILGAPWYGKLSEKLEKLRTGTVDVIEVGIISDIWRTILFELKKLVLVTLIALPLFLLNFVPVLGTLLSTVVGITVTTMIICLDFFDSILERRRLRFRQKLRIVWKSLPGSAGFALVCFLLISIPLVNLLTIPFCVGGGTLFVCDRVLLTGSLPSSNLLNDV